MITYTDRFTVQGPRLEQFSFPDDAVLMTVGDTHGQSGALRGLLKGFGRMATPGKRRVLVFLGDLIDRGPDSLGCLRTALEDGKSLAKADEVVFLPGNHELLLAEGLANVNRGVPVNENRSGAVWLMHGGAAFMDEVFAAAGITEPKDINMAMQLFAEQLPHPGHDSFVSMVRSWPSHFEMGDALCVHAGIAPRRPVSDTLELPQDTHLVEYGADNFSARHWAWICESFLEWQNGWPRSGYAADLDNPFEPGLLVIHGHSIPKNCRPSKLVDGAGVKTVFCRMETNARICVDGGSQHETGVAGLLMTNEGVRIVFEACEDL